ncbi:MAG: 16S rRNA (cytidine(1402)-2'-O)-methyltransferase [Mycoplasmoidaceae bacterium]
MNSFYIIATPIGNIDEITFRAKKLLEEVNIFFCEDTRISKKLFNHLNISIKNKKFIKCDQYLELEIKNQLLTLLKKESCALLSDAGYPTISDPGYLVKKILFENNIQPVIINGPCSIIHALVGSIAASNNFYFHGFLNKKQNKRISELMDLKKIISTIIIFESSHNLLKTLIDLQKVFGDINLNVCKELTKQNEIIYYDKISKLINKINTKGEFVIIFENNENANHISDENIISEIDKLMKKKIRIKEAARMISYKYDLKTNDVYELYLNRKGL